MHELHHALFIKYHQCGQTAGFEQLNLLPITIGYFAARIRQANKGVLLLSPMVGKGVSILRPHNENDRILRDKLGEILAQLRHVPAAVRSGKAAVKHQYHVVQCAKAGEGDFFSLKIG